MLLEQRENQIEVDPLTRLAMAAVTRRRLFRWVGRAGLGMMVGGGVTAGTLATSPTEADALGCSECWGYCDTCVSSCCVDWTPGYPPTACTQCCTCDCTAYSCACATFHAHLMWILGYIPNCTCPTC